MRDDTVLDRDAAHQTLVDLHLAAHIHHLGAVHELAEQRGLEAPHVCARNVLVLERDLGERECDRLGRDHAHRHVLARVAADLKQVGELRREREVKVALVRRQLLDAKQQAIGRVGRAIERRDLDQLAEAQIGEEPSIDLELLCVRRLVVDDERMPGVARRRARLDARGLLLAEHAPVRRLRSVSASARRPVLSALP